MPGLTSFQSNGFSIISTISRESDLEFYKCSNVSSCSWIKFGEDDITLNQSINTFRVNFTDFSGFMIAERVTPTGGGTSSGGGGGSKGSTGGTKLATLDILKPDKLEFSENETIRIPILLKNTGYIELFGIFLRASMDNELFEFEFEERFVEFLGINETFETFLVITNKGAPPAPYEVIIIADVTTPKFRDTTIIFLNIKDKDFEKIPLLVIYKQGGTIIADQPPEDLNKFEFYAFLKIYTEMYGEDLKEEFRESRGESP